MNDSIFNCMLALVIEIIYVIGCYLKDCLCSHAKSTYA